MNRLIKKLFALVFVGLLSTALVISCGKQAKEDTAGEHPTDSSEHPTDSSEHPTDSTEHAADSTKN